MNSLKERLSRPRAGEILFGFLRLLRLFAAKKPGRLIVVGVLLGCLQARGEESPAPCRLRLERNADSPWPAAAGTVEVWPSIAGSGKFNVCAADGKPVHWQVLWSAAGQPALVRFDTSSGAASYYVNFDTNAAAPPGIWTPMAGVVLETRGCKEQPVKTLEEVSRLAATSEVQGRSLVPDIFQGMNPHGPSSYYVALFNGWFNARQEGVYQFATISSGASYLQIDGRIVAEWLGRHDPQGGRRGEHSGRVSLKPGAHRIDYVQAQFDGGPAAVAAWRPPGHERLEVMPASAFLPVARFRAASFEVPPSSPGQVYVEWSELEHCLLADSLMVKVRFRVVEGGRRRNYKWTFDDGDEAAGADVQHIFPQGGMRQAAVQAFEGRASVATNSLRVRVRPNWLQREDWRQGLFEEARRSFLRRDLSRMPARDLGEVLDLAERMEDRELLRRAGETVLKRQEEFNSAAYGPAFYRLGLSFQHQGDQGDRLAEQALRLALSPQRNSLAMAERVKLRIADLLIHCDGNVEEGQKLLAGLSLGGLAAEERRLAKLLEGDGLLARGKVAEARKHYSMIGNASRAPGGGSDIGRAAVLESASISLQRGDYDEAEHALDLLVYEFPLERMSLDAGLLRANLGLKQKEFGRAFELCRALCGVAGRDPQKANLLRGMVQSGLALGKTAEAQQALRELLKTFPYSEATAKAKERWEAGR
jgi:hypothetical protein